MIGVIKSLISRFPYFVSVLLNLSLRVLTRSIGLHRAQSSLALLARRVDP